MDERHKLACELDDMQHRLKELEILYERYFAGIERREPTNDRNTLVRRVRHFTKRHIVWTDLKFRYQGLASRFMSYCQYWDRIVRLIEEGKYHRHKSKRQTPAVARPDPDAERLTQVQRLQQQMIQARKECGITGSDPSVEKISAFLEGQQEQIRSRFGDKPVEFHVDTRDGKPRIKVRLKH